MDSSAGWRDHPAYVGVLGERFGSALRKNVAPIIREIKSTGRRGGVGPAVGIFESASASSFVLSLRLSSDTRRRSSKSQVNPSYYTILCSALIYIAVQQTTCYLMVRKSSGANRYSVRPETRKWQAARDGRRGH